MKPLLLLIFIVTLAFPAHAELTKEEMETLIHIQARQIQELKQDQVEKEEIPELSPEEYRKQQQQVAENYYRAARERNAEREQQRLWAKEEARNRAVVQGMINAASNMGQYSQQRRPVNTYCNSYGFGYSSSTNCTSY